MEVDFPRGKNIITKKQFFKISNKNSQKSHFNKKSLKIKSDYQSLPFLPGNTVLAVVSHVKNYEIHVSLPCSRKGIIHITNISDDYTKLLQELISKSDVKNDMDKILSLHEIFYLGMVVRCSILEVDTSKPKSTIKLSINPKIVNKDVNLNFAPVFTGVVSSCEDHGYIINVGHPSFTTFVSLSESQKYLKQLSKSNLSVLQDFSIGVYLNCLSLNNKTTKENSLNITIDLKKLKLPISSDIVPVSMQNLLPGTILTVKVVEINEMQLTVSCSHLVGSISRMHLLLNWKAYHVNQELSAVLIFVHPIKRTLILSELKHLSNLFQSNNLFGELSVGDIIENAEVISIKKKYGVFLKISGHTRMFARWNQVSFSKNNDIGFKKGDLLKCRIINLNYFDKIISVTLRQDIINQPYFKRDDISIGEIVKCQVHKATSKGLIVSIFNNVKGFVPNFHISDIPLKNPEKKYPQGKIIKCRVMKNNLDPQKLILTHKKMLLKPKYNIPFNYSDLQVGKLITGCVGKVSSFGLVVVFFNDVRGWVPKAELSFQIIESPEKVFYLGQVVNCLVKACNVKEEKLILSLKTYIGFNSSNEKIIFKIGDTIDCKVSQKTNIGLYVNQSSSNTNGFIPISHLSDFSSNCDLYMLFYEVNCIIKSAMIIENKNTDNFILTRKNSFKEMIHEENLITDIDELALEKAYNGFIKKKVDYGVFVQINNFTGLVLKKDIVDIPHPDPISLLEEGQTIICRVKEIDNENSRFLVSLRLKNIDMVKSPITYLYEYLNENIFLRNGILNKSEFALFKKYNIGDLVKIKITSITSLGILGTLNDDIPAYVINDNIDDIICQINHSYDAIILYIDLISKTVQLSLNSTLVKASRSYQKSKFSNVLVGQVIKSEVQFINKDFILVSLKNHGVGQFAYLPAKNHFSDFIERFKFNIGQQNQVVIKRVLDSGHILASLEIHEIATPIQTFDTAKPGDILLATVKKICAFQINIVAAGLPGRIHVTEIVDEFDNSESNLMSSFKEHDRIKIKVIGYRYGKLNQKIMLECSVRPSKLSQPIKNWPVQPSLDNLNIGDEVIGFVTLVNNVGISLQFSIELKGFVNFLYVSKSAKILNKAKDNYQIGARYKAWILSKQNHSIQLTMIQNIKQPKVGNIVTGKILKTFPDHLFLQLPLDNIAYTSFNDKINDISLKFVKVKILKECAGPKKKFVVTLDYEKNTASKTKAKDNEERHSEIQVNHISSSNEDSIAKDDVCIKKHLVLPSKFCWDEDDVQPNAELNLPEDSDSDSEKDEPPLKKSKLSSQLNKYETERLNHEKTIFQDPNISLNWVKFISFELGNNDIDKARSIAEKALKTISFREENEKLNIWICYMNLESTYGSDETLIKIVERAKQNCDPFKVMCHLKDIYSSAGRLEDAIIICKTLVKRYKQNMEAWCTFGLLLYKSGKLQEARELLSDCLLRIPIKDRIEVTSRFAQFEAKYGIAERGETLLEDIVKNFSKRTDVWSMYADMCIKNGNIDQARQVLERATNLSLNPKKMKFLFEKYLHFELKFGNDETVMTVKEKATKYAKN